MREVNLLPPRVVRAKVLRVRLIRLGLAQGLIALVLLGAVAYVNRYERYLWEKVQSFERVIHSAEQGNHFNDTSNEQARARDMFIERAYSDLSASKKDLEWLMVLEDSLPQGSVITRLEMADSEVYIRGIGLRITSAEEHRLNLLGTFENARLGLLTDLGDGSYSYELWARMEEGS